MGRKKIRRLSHFRGEKKDTVGIHAAKLLIRRLRINTQSPVGGRGEGDTRGRAGGESCLPSGPQAAGLDWARLFGGGGAPWGR